MTNATENPFKKPYLQFCPHAANRMDIMLQGLLPEVRAALLRLVVQKNAEETIRLNVGGSANHGATFSHSIVLQERVEPNEDDGGETEVPEMRLSAITYAGTSDLNTHSNDECFITLPNGIKINIVAERGKMKKVLGRGGSIELQMPIELDMGEGKIGKGVIPFGWKYSGGDVDMEDDQGPVIIPQIISRITPCGFNTEIRSSLRFINQAFG